MARTLPRKYSATASTACPDCFQCSHVCVPFEFNANGRLISHFCCSAMFSKSSFFSKVLHAVCARQTSRSSQSSPESTQAPPWSPSGTALAKEPSLDQGDQRCLGHPLAPSLPCRVPSLWRHVKHELNDLLLAGIPQLNVKKTTLFYHTQMTRLPRTTGSLLGAARSLLVCFIFFFLCVWW
jgi:hypothetical protein